METLIKKKEDAKQWMKIAEKLALEFSARAGQYDSTDTFVKENYDSLKANKFFAAAVPKELGGGGMSYTEMCAIIRLFGRHCGSTALAFSMHQHLVAANVWKYKRQKGGESTLRRVARTQAVLVSTGAKDWLESNGELEKVQGGYLFNGIKHFASQSVVGAILVTSAPYLDPELGWQVLHFPVPFSADGLTVLDNWKTMGMRGTGSCSVKIENVFIREGSVAVKRDRGVYAPLWNVVLTVAMPYIMSAYVGIAERAAEIAIAETKKNDCDKAQISFMIGAMNNSLTNAQVVLDDMIRITNNYDFQPITENGNAILSRKTLVVDAVKKTVAKAMEIVGGQSYFRNAELERLFRDVQAAHFHPLPEKEQQLFSGEFLLNRAA